MTSYKDIIAALPTMTSEQLAQIKGRVVMLAENGEHGTHDEEEILFRSIEDVLSGYSIMRKMGYTAFVARSRDYTTYMKNSSVVFEFVRENFPGIMKSQKHKLFTIFARLIVDHVKNMVVGEEGNRRPVPLALRTIVNHLDKVPALIHGAFPGYGESGLLTQIVGDDAFYRNQLDLDFVTPKEKRIS